MKTLNRHKILGVLGAIAAVLLLTAPNAAAAGPQLATIRSSGGGLEWTVLSSVAGVELRVGGGGFNHAETFRGRNPRFEARTADGAQLPDGIYKWELRAYPEGIQPVSNGLDNGRDANLEAAPQRGFVNRRPKGQAIVQTGSFTVRGGSVIDPNVIETSGLAAK
jgi:hypothetical protein